METNIALHDKSKQPDKATKKFRKSSAPIWLLVVMSLCLNLYGIHWGLPNGVQDWANDSLAPLGPLVYAKRLVFQELWSSKYPPVHYMVLAVLYAPYVLYLHITGGITTPTDVYPFGLVDPEVSLMVLTLIARLTSAVMGTGLVLVTYYTVKRLYGHQAGLISAFLIASSYVVLYYAHNANVEIPQLFWLSLSLYCFVVLVQTYQTKYYVLLGLFAALAIGTKDSIYALFLGLPLPLLWFHIRNECAMGKRVLPSLFHRKLFYSVLAFVVTLILAFNFPLNWQGVTDHVELHIQKSISGSRIIQDSESEVQGDLLLISKYFFHLLQINGTPIGLVLFVSFLYYLIIHPRKSWFFLIPLMTYYIFFLRIFPVSSVRYVLPVYLLLTWQAGKFVSVLLAYKKFPRWVATIPICFILLYSLLHGFSLDWLLIHDSRYAVEKWIKDYIPDNALIAAYGPGYSLPRFPARIHVQSIELGKDVSDPRALCSLSGRRVTGTMYSFQTPFSLTLTVVDQTPYTLALYFVDWDSYEREQIITLYDVSSNTILDQRTLTDFHDGIYYTYAVQGSVRVEVAITRGVSAVLSGVFWNQSAPGQNPSAFLRADTTTRGNWQDVYGSEGFLLANRQGMDRDMATLPSYLQSYDYSSNTGFWLWQQTSPSDDATEMGAEYVIVNMSLPSRIEQQSNIYRSFTDQSYRLVASLKSDIPFWGADIFHAVNPRFAIFKRLHDPAHHREVPVVPASCPGRR